MKGDLDGLDLAHVEQMARMAAGPAGRSVDLPGGLLFSVDYDEVTISSGGAFLRPATIDGCHDLEVPGETRVGPWRISTRVLGRGEWEKAVGKPAPYARLAHLSLAAVQGVQVRSRRAGDRFQPMGMSGHKKLQDFMVDSHIPRATRDATPLVVAGPGIAWVVGWRIAEWARVREDDDTVLELLFSLADG